MGTFEVIVCVRLYLVEFKLLAIRALAVRERPSLEPAGFDGVRVRRSGCAADVCLAVGTQRHRNLAIAEHIAEAGSVVGQAWAPDLPLPPQPKASGRVLVLEGLGELMLIAAAQLQQAATVLLWSRLPFQGKRISLIDL